MTIRAYAAREAGGPLTPFEYERTELLPDEIDVDVESCGICHSDLSMIDDEWQMSRFPLVPGHEIVGRVSRRGSGVSHLEPGQRVGLGWYSRSCLTCRECLYGRHNRCPEGEGIIVGRSGGFAESVRCQAAWAVPLPHGIDAASAGPLFCGGITVFNPIVRSGIRPTDRVGVVGIGGLGHLALKFLRAWGCHVTAFSTSPAKEDTALEMGAHRFTATRAPQALEELRETFDMVLVTVAAELDWDAYIATLRPGGKLHLVGAAPSVQATVFPMIGGEKSIGASPLGSPALIGDMLEFCARHDIRPVTERFAMSQINAALDHLRAGRARYRIVLENDFD